VDAEVVTFEGHRPRFELTPYPGKPDWSVVRLIHLGRQQTATAAPGAPAELAATLRERACCPMDVVRITTELGMAALERAA
jgi:hypothetical protein